MEQKEQSYVEEKDMQTVKKSTNNSTEKSGG
jgi:hypothetical protein